jgi:hypothetical protein
MSTHIFGPFNHLTLFVSAYGFDSSRLPRIVVGLIPNYLSTNVHPAVNGGAIMWIHMDAETVHE